MSQNESGGAFFGALLSLTPDAISGHFAHDLFKFSLFWEWSRRKRAVSCWSQAIKGINITLLPKNPSTVPIVVGNRAPGMNIDHSQSITGVIRIQQLNGIGLFQTHELSNAVVAFQRMCPPFFVPVERPVV